MTQHRGSAQPAKPTRKITYSFRPTTSPRTLEQRISAYLEARECPIDIAKTAARLAVNGPCDLNPNHRRAITESIKSLGIRSLRDLPKLAQSKSAVGHKSRH